MSDLLIKNWSKADWKELLKWAKIGANNAMIGEFTEVEELQADVPRWIPVSERLPENTNPVIAFCNGKAGNVSFEDAEIFAIYEEGEGWWWDSYPEISHIPVTHWMPLPEPPKEEQNNANTD